MFVHSWYVGWIHDAMWVLLCAIYYFTYVQKHFRNMYVRGITSLGVAYSMFIPFPVNLSSRPGFCGYPATQGAAWWVIRRQILLPLFRLSPVQCAGSRFFSIGLGWGAVVQGWKKHTTSFIPDHLPVHEGITSGTVKMSVSWLQFARGIIPNVYFSSLVDSHSLTAGWTQ